ncbi:MAG: phosphoribosylamine--glycine ligase [Proteobacteria bacterium]|nr:phosphoribosylamine--glycine ligase [Pseudomonadota bacterium]
MKVLVIGSGGREHALIWKIQQSPKVSHTYCAPGNAGIAEIAETVNLSASDIEGLARFASKNEVDLTIVGPEVPLTMGIVDLFEKSGLKIFGPSKKAAEMEGSKSFSKEIMKKYGIPTAAYESFTSKEEALTYIDRVGAPIVIKADGLAAGKGVVVAMTVEEAKAAVHSIMGEKVFGSAGNSVVIEEFMEGEEASILAFSDGKNVAMLPSAQDHKPIFDDDYGPNTGGMGAYSPAPVITKEMEKEILETIIIPTIKGMASEGRAYKGILYTGLMITDKRPKVVEFNARFGDPECQPLMMRMESDIIPVMEASTDGTLDKVDIKWKEGASVCVVMASKGYPGSYKKGQVISGLDTLKKEENVFVFHAGTKESGEDVVTNGGRVLGVTATGENVKNAITRAYGAVHKINWDGAYFRKDIGKKALERNQ